MFRIKYFPVFTLLFLAILIPFLIVATFQSKTIEKEINELLVDNTSEIIFIDAGFTKMKYIIGKPVEIKSLLLNIINWKTIDGIFEKGGEYPYYKFIIKNNDHTIAIFITINYQNNCIRLRFDEKNKWFNISKQIESIDLIDNMLSFLPLSGTK